LSVPTATDLSFERFMSDAFKNFGRTFYDMEEDEKSWTLSIDVPGISKEHLSVSIDGKFVRIETNDQAKRQFAGAYELPGAINPEGTEAKLEDGVLTLKLAKLEQKTARQITVN
jgi:HSP20 family protein